jgi:hypothetical protein
LVSSATKQSHEGCLDGDCVVRILKEDKPLYIPVYNLKLEDRIFCFGNSFEQIDNITISIQDRLYIEHQNGIIIVSKSHKFLLENYEEKKASTFRIGNSIMTDTGKGSKILNIKEVGHNLVYDISLSGPNKLYFAEGVLNAAIK